MKARDYMTRDTICIDSSKSILEAYRLMITHSVRHLPVLEDQKLVGILSDRDVLVNITPAEDEWEITSVTVGEAMSPSPICCHPETPIWEAAGLMVEYRINAIPVIDENRALLGIVTSTDLLRFANDKGWWLDLMKEQDKPLSVSF